MKRSKQLRYFEKLKAAMVVLLAVAIALVALPFGLLAKSGVISSASAEEDGGKTTATVEVTVNFYSLEYSADGYPYDLHLWAFESGGTDYEFEKDTVTMRNKKWKTVTVTIKDVPFDSANPTANAIGVIYKHGTENDERWGWQTKDLFIPANKIVNNKVTIYLVNGYEEIYYNPEDPDLSTKFKEAKFNCMMVNNQETYRVQLETGSAKLTETTKLIIKDSNGAVHGTLDCTVAENASLVGKNSANINFTGTFDFAETYTLVDESTDEETRFATATVNKVSLYDNETAFTSKYNYEGTLGAEYSKAQTKFTVWSPVAKSVKLNIYAAGEGGVAESYDMTAGEKGTWTHTLSGDQNGKYYTYTVGNKEIVDPYARSAGRNGKRGMILDLDTTDPEGWATHSRPAARGSYSNAVIYETHIRDITVHPSSNVSAANRGKFLGLTEKASEDNGNKKTPLDHIKELGVTEVHILPMFDFATVNETFNVAELDGENQYNWGYDPLNYNVPEGSYSSNPANGAVRVKELKQMVMALHEAGIRVIMDVVYNHVSNAGNSNFEALLPDYFFRTDNTGKKTNGSGCGNDTASERFMYHKFMVESVNYWADEYKLDGFRFDLMGLHDIDTMNEIYNTLSAKNSDIMVYGEGWRMGTLEDTKAANMFNASQMPNIAFFNDITRDALKGGGFGMPMTARGYVEGGRGDAGVYIGAVGGTTNGDAGYRSLGKSAFAANPTQNINYVSCHDNASLWDKINACSLSNDEATLKAMNRLAATAVLTSQGPTFFLAGEEMLRSKPVDKDKHALVYNEANNEWSDPTYDSRPYAWITDSEHLFSDNSYKSPDSVNAIDWTLAETNADMVDFYKQLIALRKNSPMFRLTTKAQIDACVTIADSKISDGLVAYAVKDPDSDEYAVLLFNNNAEATEMAVPNGEYCIYVNGAQANGTTALSTFTGDKVTVGAFSAVVMKGELEAEQVAAWKVAARPSTETPPASTDNKGDDDDTNLGLALGLGIGIPAAVLIAGGAVFGAMYSKKKKGNGGDKAENNAQPEQSDNPEPTQAENAENTENAEGEENAPTENPDNE